MKRNLLFTFVLFASNLLFSQDYKQKRAKSACECANALNIEKLEEKAMHTQLGICLIKASMPYSKEIKKEYNIDLSRDIGNVKKMEELGKQVALMMMSECPDIFSKMNMNKDEKADAEEDTDNYSLINGTITKIEKDNLVVFHLMGENKVLTKLYWVSSIESNLDLPKEYSTLLNKKVSITYYTTEIFDSKINDYRNLNIISNLKTDN